MDLWFSPLPSLIAAEVPSVLANASAVALYPGGVTSVRVYRDGLGRVRGVPLAPILAVAGALARMVATAMTVIFLARACG